MNYRPLPESLTIKQSTIEGLGVIAVTDLEEDSNLGISHVKVDDKLIRTPLGGFLNHSIEPNCKILENKYFDLITIKPIFAGQELTVDYRNNLCGEKYDFL